MAPRILLVEDNPITRKLVRFVFQGERVELSEAPDGATAMALVHTERPDLILQDLLLPDMDGFELVGRLRSLPAASDIPILAFSGFLSQVDESRISGSGFTDFVTKPIEPSQLLRIVKAYLPSDAPKPAFGHGRRIVLADDDDVQRKLSVFKLSRLGFEVTDAGSGRAALDAARAHPPDAMVTDAMMPGLDGFGVCAEMRADPVLKSVPIVLVTSTYVDEEDRRLGRLAGADAFAIRTPDHREMIAALELVLAGAPTAAAQPQDFERERASRIQAQLDRQLVFAAGARQQCSLLSAELAVLNAISEAITRHEDIDLVLRDILSACCDAAGVSIGALCLAEPHARTVLVGSYAGAAEGDAGLFSDDLAGLGGTIGANTAMVVTRRAPIDEATRRWLDSRRLASALVVPLRHKSSVLGSLVMMSDLVDLSLDNRTMFAEAVGHQVSVALALTAAFDDSAAAERRSRAQAALLESVFASITDPIVVGDELGRASAWNAAAGSMFGLGASGEPRELDEMWISGVGLYRIDKLTPLGRSELPLMRAVAGDTIDGQEMYLRNDGRPEGAWLTVSAKPLRDEHGVVRGAVSVSRDVTAERLAHEHLLISDRMASVGMLAASVGHEINNPLASVVANLEMAAADLTRLSGQHTGVAWDELPAEISEALEAAQRVRRIARDLKVFSGGSDEANGPVDVEAVLESSIRMAWNEVRHRATVVKRYSAIPPALGVESRLGQVFLNLIVNAAQAIPEGQADQHQIYLTTRLESDSRITIDIRDTGSGIPPHMMSQLFTPFVTTKPVGIGTGLGLSICQRLVTAMGGEIWAESEEGVGTVFHVRLVQAAPAATTAPDEVQGETADAPRPGRILVIDDEEMMGMLVKRTLRRHNVTSTTSAADALGMIRGGARYDVIFCDLMMPLMTGIEFYEALRQDAPGQAMAIVFLTGGAFSKDTAGFLDSVANPHLEKPFDVAALRKFADARVAAAAGGSKRNS